MRLYPRIVFFLVLMCLLPLGVLAVSGVQATHGWLRRTIVAGQQERAAILAEMVGRRIDESERLLALQLGSFQLMHASDDALLAFLYATWRLSPDIAVAVVQDRAGRDLAAPVFQAPGQPLLAPGHDVVGAEEVLAFRKEVPIPTRAGEVARGKPRLRAGGSPWIPLALASPWGDGIVLAVALRVALPELAVPGDAVREVALLAADGTLLAREGATGWVEADKLTPLMTSPAGDAAYETAAGEAVLVSFAGVPGYPLVVVVAEPESVVGDAGRDIRERTLYIAGVAVVVALVLGTILTRSIAGPVRRLGDAAGAVGRGDLGQRVAVDGDDELAELGAAFNTMTESLERSAREIAAKNREIEGFNRDLQARVDKRTAELRDAQARLVQSGQRAAVAELSAGLAHELNNPLAGLLGLIQIAAVKSGETPVTPLLRRAEQEALRCKDIVAHLLKLTEPAAEERVREPLALDALVTDVLGLVGSQLRAREITVQWAPPAVPVRVVGDPPALGRALGQMLTGLRGVGARGATLTVAVATRGGKAELRLALDATAGSLDDWKAAALGFWVARQVLEDHAATLEEPDPRGAGAAAAWTIALPLAAPRSGA